MDNNENIQFDCSRGCTVTRNEKDELNCTYRRGCCKLEDYDWLQGVSQRQFSDVFEVRFKNTRKVFYVHASGQSLKMGDMVIVEAQERPRPWNRDSGGTACGPPDEMQGPRS